MQTFTKLGSLPWRQADAPSHWVPNVLGATVGKLLQQAIFFCRRGKQWPTLILALTLAYGGGLWLYLLREFIGNSTGIGLSAIINYWSSATLALPLVLLATWLGLWSIRHWIKQDVQFIAPLVVASSAAALVALLASVAMGSTMLLQDLAFTPGYADEVQPWWLVWANQSLLALALNLPIAGLVCLWLGESLWQVALVRPFALRIGPRPRRYLQIGLLILAFILPPFDVGLQPVLAAGICPNNAPTKIFDVSAIDVKMWLDRFGNHDPAAQMYVLTALNGQPTPGIAAVRAQEAAGPSSLTLGLRDDPIQPLAIRANQGDCVIINFKNETTRPAPQGDTPGSTTNVYGMHIDGLVYQMSSSGNNIGYNGQSAVPQGGTIQYTYYIPNDPTIEGAHYIHPGPGNRQAVAHGLFGTLNVEPPGSIYLNMTTGQPQPSGWEAIIVPGNGDKAFRENVKVMHEIGNDEEGEFLPVDIEGESLPQIDPYTSAYRPASRAINYRAEPFMNRLEYAENQKSSVYSSYTFGDTSNVIARGYVGDPTKFRMVHGGSEVFHVYHLHGGAIRWRLNPHADPSYDYAKTGLNKEPVTIHSNSARLDAQSAGPGEAYDLEIEHGAGGAQQGAGEFLFHCHIAHHYFAGMWGFWRAYDTLQPDLMPLPDRAALPAAVDSATLIGKSIYGQNITAANLDAWIRPQLPPPGVTRDVVPGTKDDANQDASVWDWAVDNSTGQPIYLGEPDRLFITPKIGPNPLREKPWMNYANVVPGRPSALLIDQTVQSTYLLNGQRVTFSAGGYIGNRPKILFNPTNGRPAWPLLRPHIGKRPPFSPNGHSGAPYLGEKGGQAANPTLPVGTTSTAPADPWANRPDGICPAGAPLRTFNVVGIPVPIQVTAPNKGNIIDPNGALFVLSEDKAAIYAGTKTYAGAPGREPLAIRGNIGDCIAVTYTSELNDGSIELPYSKTNLHIHHVQFDTQGSDGVVAGFSFEQSIRPYKLVDPQLTAPLAVGDTLLRLTRVAKFQPGVWIAIGMGLESIEIRQIVAVDNANATVTISQPVSKAHAADEWAGTEFTQHRWYPDVQLDNVFFHDHVNGIHGWSHGMVGQFVVEPKGATFHDPVTGAEIKAGAIADIHTTACGSGASNTGSPCSLIPGVIDGSFREFVLWTINDHEAEAPIGLKNPDATLNLRAEPWAVRSSDPALRFSSNTPQGDPFTPLPRAYAGDPFVIRNVNVGQGTNTLRIDGHRTFWEPRYRDALGIASSPIDTIHTTVAEKFTLILDGGAGGPKRIPGDYLYHDGENRRFIDGAWGIIRVLPSLVADLKPLPGTSIPAPVATCPTGAPQRNFAISAVRVPDSPTGGGSEGRKLAYVPTAQAAAVMNGQIFPEPLVLHVAAGECVKVAFSNQLNGEKASFQLGGLLRDLSSTGSNIGFNPDTLVASGAARTYTFYADNPKLESVLISDFGGDNGGWDGLYGALVVAPAGATFSHPTSGQATDIGAQVDVHLPDGSGYRDFTLLLADHDPVIGQSKMPYQANVSGPALINYRQVLNRVDDADMFSSVVHGDPATPLLRAYAGDPVKVHVLGAPGSEQVHVFNLGGMSWPGDMYIANANQWQNRGVGPWEKLDLKISGGAGGVGQVPGDYFYGDRKGHFTQAGMWGIFRVLPNSCNSGQPTDLRCLATAGAPLPTVTAINPTSGPAAGGTVVTITGSGFSTASGGTSVRFGATAATNVTCSSSSSCTATSPAGAGTVDVVMTVNGQSSAVSNASKFTYTTVNTPTPSTVTVNVPALSKGYGYYVVINSTGAGPVKATWSHPTSVKGVLAIYAGNPFAGKANPLKLAPPSGALVKQSSTRTKFSVATKTKPAGQYTIYFYASNSTPASTGTATYLTNVAQSASVESLVEQPVEQVGTEEETVTEGDIVLDEEGVVEEETEIDPSTPVTTTNTLNNAVYLPMVEN